VLLPVVDSDEAPVEAPVLPVEPTVPSDVPAITPVDSLGPLVPPVVPRDVVVTAPVVEPVAVEVGEPEELATSVLWIELVLVCPSEIPKVST